MWWCVAVVELTINEHRVVGEVWIVCFILHVLRRVQHCFMFHFGGCVLGKRFQRLVLFMVRLSNIPAKRRAIANGFWWTAASRQSSPEAGTERAVLKVAVLPVL